ncbi:MAG: lysostaphin resistance A-like protein [Opitutales bacterium]
MDSPAVDAPWIIATLLILTILLSSAVLWIREVQKPKDLMQNDVGVSAWSIGWVNFGILICAIIVATLLFQSLVFMFVDQPVDPELEIEFTPGIAVLSVLATQGPLIAVFFLARRFYPEIYAGRLSRAKLKASEAFMQALPLFLMFLPVVWATSYLWSKLLLTLEKFGVIEEFLPQDIIVLLREENNIPLVIAVVIMAVIVAPIVEELIFRGCLYRFLKSQTTILLSQILSGMCFALVHFNLMSFVPLLVVGVLLARVYEKTGSIAVAIWFHAFFNALTICILFISSMSDSLSPNY